jgi:hypothetical protein
MINWVTQIFGDFMSDGNFWSGIVGALVGSVTGGTIAYFVQVAAFREARRLRVEEQLLSKQSLATSLMFKVMRAHGNASTINSHIKECLDRIGDQEMEPWQVFIPLANFPAQIHFASEEQTMLFGLKDNKVFELAIDIDVANNSLIDAVEILSQERRTLASSLNNETIQGNVGTIRVENSALLKIRPKMIEVNQLIEQTSNDAKRLEVEAMNSMIQLSQLFDERLGLSISTELKPKNSANA